MSPWQQTFNNQQLNQKLDNALSSLDGVTLEGFDPAQIEQYARLVKVVKFIRARLKSIDPELVRQAALNNLSTWITNILGQAQGFSYSRSFGRSKNANKLANSILRG